MSLLKTTPQVLNRNLPSTNTSVFAQPSSEDIDPEGPDPTRPSLSAITNAGHAFSIPWHHEVRALLSGFNSSLMTAPPDTNPFSHKTPPIPWVMACPFDLSCMNTTAMCIVPETTGGNASFRDGYSTHSGSSNEHLSAALGVTVGYSFLSASVSGKYDKTVTACENGIQASRNTSCRTGRIILSQTPILTSTAIKLLQSPAGHTKFKNLYGDYYIAGYELGADAGACLSASTSSSSSEECLEITVTVKVLFYEATATYTERSSSSTASSEMVFSGYSTLDTESKKLSGNVSCGGGGDVEMMKLAAVEYLAKVATLDVDVRRLMRKLSLKDGDVIPIGKCSEICNEGIVVQLLLAPYARLNQFIEAIGKVNVDAP